MTIARVLVTGASGFIGKPASEALRRRGYEVHELASRAVRSEPRVHRVDLFDAQAVDGVIASLRPTHLLHLAWITTPAYWTSLDNLRWTAASLSLVEAFRRHGGQRIVCAGTCAEYAWTGGGRCSESQTPLAPATLYGTAKHALQAVLAAYAREAGTSFAWGRVFFAYGPAERDERLVPSVIRKLLARERVACTDGEQQRDFLHVDDVGDAFAALVDSDVQGPVNIGSGEPIALRHIITRIAAKLDGTSLVDLGALPRRAGDPPLLVADVTRLTAEVGWRPRISLEEGLDTTIAWWRTRALA